MPLGSRPFSIFCLRGIPPVREHSIAFRIPAKTHPRSIQGHSRARDKLPKWKLRSPVQLAPEVDPTALGGETTQPKPLKTKQERSMKMGRGGKGVHVEPGTRRRCSRSVHPQPSTRPRSTSLPRTLPVSKARSTARWSGSVHRSPRA